MSGKDNLGAYGEHESDQAHRYVRTKEFLQLVRKLWTEENVTYRGEHFQVTDSTVLPRIPPRGDRTHPTLYFGGASEAAERVAATEADVQLFWGEPLAGAQERIERLRSLSEELGRAHAPLEFGLRITTFVRDTTEQAWAEAEAKVAEMAKNQGAPPQNPHRQTAVGQQRLLDLATRGDVLDDNLYTAPGRSVAAARAPPGSSAPRRTSRSRCASTRTSASPTSYSPTPSICRRSSVRATSCCRYCGNEPGGATCASRNRFAQTVTVTRPRCRRERVTGCHRVVALSHNESQRTKHAGIFTSVRA